MLYSYGTVAAAATAAVTAASVIGFLILRKRALRRSNQLKKVNYEKDVVYMYNFASCPTIVSISPYGLKLETWLRLKHISHETARKPFVWSSKGQIPFVELNGEQINESNIVMRTLARHFDAGDEKILNAEQMGQAHALGMMLESRTVMSYFYFRYGPDVKNFFKEWKFAGRILTAFAILNFPRVFLKRIKLHGIGDGSIEEVYQTGFEDLRALSKFLGDKNYLFGDTMTTADCYAFGHLAQILYLPIAYPHKAFLRQEANNLCDYCDRIRDRIWPDWDQICRDNLCEA